MTLYTLYDLYLEVSQEVSDTEAVLDQLLLDLSCVRTRAAAREPDLCLSVYRHPNRRRLPPMTREIFRADGFCGLEHGDDCYLTDGASLLQLQAKQGQGEAHLAPTFWRKPLPLQRTFGPLACSSCCGHEAFTACMRQAWRPLPDVGCSSLAAQAVASPP